jgi:DTW domain-containing protein YfiP
MMKHFNKIVSKPVTRVKINPVQKSNFSRTQTQPDRICTLEAAVMMLRELGESDQLCQTLLDSMEANIVALQVRSFRIPSKKQKQKSEEEKDEDTDIPNDTTTQ